MKFLILLLSVVSLEFIETSLCQAQPVIEKKLPEKKSSKKKSKLRTLIDESLDWYQLYPTAESSTLMQYRTVLRWTNNARGSAEGLTVIWVSQGRPEAVACIYPWKGYLVHEFSSLSRGSLVAQKGGNLVWQPDESGLNFRSIPDAPAPAESKAARLRQMKKLASQFHSTMLGWKSDDSDREQLRLLTRPLYRYESKIPDLIDGAIFAFAQGTDPESLLLIEAFRVGKTFQWQYAFVRRTSGALEGRFLKKVVWTAPKFPVNNNPRKPYFSLKHKIMP